MKKHSHGLQGDSMVMRSMADLFVNSGINHIYLLNKLYRFVGKFQNKIDIGNKIRWKKKKKENPLMLNIILYNTMYELYFFYKLYIVWKIGEA
jgi:hypothetical protein